MNPTEPVKKRGGRPASETKRDQQITVCLTKLEKLALKRRADKKQGERFFTPDSRRSSRFDPEEKTVGSFLGVKHGWLLNMRTYKWHASRNNASCFFPF